MSNYWLKTSRKKEIKSIVKKAIDNFRNNRAKKVK